MAKRKMTPEQRQAASERLAKAREKKIERIHLRIKTLLRLFLNEVKTIHSTFERCRVGSRLRKSCYHLHVNPYEGKKRCGVTCCKSPHTSNLETYLRSGDYVDDFYGEMGEHQIKWRCVAYYDTDGMARDPTEFSI